MQATSPCASAYSWCGIKRKNAERSLTGFCSIVTLVPMIFVGFNEVFSVVTCLRMIRSVSAFMCILSVCARTLPRYKKHAVCARVGCGNPTAVSLSRESCCAGEAVMVVVRKARMRRNVLTGSRVGTREDVLSTREDVIVDREDDAGAWQDAAVFLRLLCFILRLPCVGRGLRRFTA